MKKVVQRRCIGCMQSKEKNELIRIVLYEGEIKLDVSGKAKGRGAYLCPNRDCLEKAIKNNGLARSFRMAVGKDVMERIAEEIEGLETNA